MAIVNLKVPTHKGGEAGATVLADIKSDMQQIESSNNALEARQFIVDSAAAQVIANAAVVAADAAVVAADKAAVATDRAATKAAWTAALAANPALNPQVHMNPSIVTTDLSIPDHYNASAVGDLEVGFGVTITVGNNASLSII